jgi:hypothetical protein
MFKNLKKDKHCSDYILDVVEYIERNLLRVDKSERANVQDIVKKFDELHGCCVGVTGYCTERTKLADRTDSGLSKTVEVPDSPTKSVAFEGTQHFRSRGSPSRSRKSPSLGSHRDTPLSVVQESNGLSTTNGVAYRQRGDSASIESVDVGVGDLFLGGPGDIPVQDASKSSIRGRRESSSEATFRTSQLKDKASGPIGSERPLSLADATRSENTSHETPGSEDHPTQFQPSISAEVADGVEHTNGSIVKKDSHNRGSRDETTREQRPKDNSGAQYLPHQPVARTNLDRSLISGGSPQTDSPTARHRTWLRKLRDRSRRWSLKAVDRIFPPAK